uniref:ArfGAP with RhoGAP domain, ankyrin repeat and PH domain 2 n=1 Tax=Oryzias latipes TaxID=8090 RepID=A0A3P9M0Q3_ORYLA
MSDPPDPGWEVAKWLSALRLSQYTSEFQQAGYRAVEDCKELTDQRLFELNVFPTGHRRRILRSLEVLGLKQLSGDEEERGDLETARSQRKPMPYPRRVFLKDRKRGVSCQQLQEKREPQSEGSQTLPAGAGLGETSFCPLGSQHAPFPQPAPRNPQNIQTSLPASISSVSSGSSSTSEISLDGEVSSEELSTAVDAAPPAANAPFPLPSNDVSRDDLKMVENSIYEMQPSLEHRSGPRPTWSYKLRHRPVPEIPSLNPLVLQDRSAPPAQTTNSEQLTGSDGPTGANGTQKAPVERKLTPIAPYSETFLYNNPETAPVQSAKEGLQKGLKVNLKQKKHRKKSKDKDCEPPAPVPPSPCEDEYSTVEEGAGMLPVACSEQSLASSVEAKAAAAESRVMVNCDLYSASTDAPATSTKNENPDISPYACFYRGPKQAGLRVGWLDKLSPQGNCVFQRRWVRFDGESLAYYNNEKEMYSKGLILASAIRQVRGLGDNKFEVITSLRTFIFRAEGEGERQEWIEALQTATQPPAFSSQKRSNTLSHLSSTNKRGLLELRGYKGKVLVSLVGSKVRLCKTEQDYKAGLGISEVELTAANIRDMDRRGFEINTPFKNFCFTAESEQEKAEWVEAIQESIVETLSDYEVAEKIWFNEANRSCADCRAPQPEWASTNLGVVICKKCAGQHRFLGPSISKVRSLKLDSSIWSNELVEFFLEVGNKKANSFWTANLPLEEELHIGASTEQRATFIRRKYKERKYRRLLEDFEHVVQLNQALCASVVTPDVLQTMALVFTGANVMCATGDPTYSTPYLLAQRAGQKVQMEFLHQNKLSDFPVVEPWSESAALSESSVFMDGFLYISSGPVKMILDRRGRDDMARRWCTLEGGSLSFYQSERSSSALGRVQINEVVSLAVSNSETIIGAGAVFTVELYLQTERALTIGAATQDAQHHWIQALTKCFIPPKFEGLVRKGAELIGRLHYKEGHDLYSWRVGWFMLEGSALHFSSGDEEGLLQLKQLQELTVSSHTQGEDKIQVLLMVESGRTVYIHGFNNLDFSLWHSAIILAAGTGSKALSEQQLTKNGIPIILESCIAFVTQYGFCQEGVYEKLGDPTRVGLLLEEFNRDARSVKLREKEHKLEDVTDTLKSFLIHLEDALLIKELYPYWVSALDERDESLRVKKYSTFIESLPKIHKMTLDALLQHLYRIHQCSHLNHMPSEKLATVFSCCFFQTQGQTTQEINVVQDLIRNYVTLFRVNEDQVQQMERENSFITRWNDKKDTSFCPAGDLIFEVYLEKREPEQCLLIKVSPSMRPLELAETALRMRGTTFEADGCWTAFEVIENGELERPLHPCERILEQVLEWSTLESPSSAFLVIKKFPWTKRIQDAKDQTQFKKCDNLKFSDGSSKLLSGHKFQEKYVVLRSEKLLIYRDMKSTKVEKAVQLKFVKCYLGLKKKLKPPTNWGFTVYTDKQRWHFCCNKKETQVSWVTDIIAMKYGPDLHLMPANDMEKSDLELSFGPVLTECSTLPHHKLADRRTSLANDELRNTKVSALHLKTKSMGNPSTCSDLPIASLAEKTNISEISFPGRLPPPSKSRHLQPMPLPPSPQSGCKTPGKRPGVGGDNFIPPNFLSELNSVLSKTGRKADD